MHIPKEQSSPVPKYVPQITRGRVVKVYDGDTITIIGRVMYNPRLFTFQIRLNDIDCPELRSKDPVEKEMATIAKNFLSDIIYEKMVVLKVTGLDKYGRLLAHVYHDGVQLNDLMLTNRLAVKYDGGTKQSPADWKKYHESTLN